MLLSVRSTNALIPLLTVYILPISALIFELPSQAHKRNAHHHALSQKFKRDPNLPSGWSYLGCYSDGPTRTLAASNSASETMTIETCITYCADHSYIYAGLEYSKECYCDNEIRNGASTSTGCDMMCAGTTDGSEVCGGGYRLSVYVSSNAPPTALTSYAGWGYQGCYVDDIATRSLSVVMGYTAPLTPQKCLDACHAQGYAIAGVEYADECYCDNEIRNTGILATEASCDMVCSGDGSLLCGGPNRLNLYEYGVAAVEVLTTSTSATQTTQTSSILSQTSSSTTSMTTVSSSTSSTILLSTSTPSAAIAAQTPTWSSLGCYTDNVNSRTLATASGATGPMTIDICQTACAEAGYFYAGVEYAAECYCANAINTSANLATDGRCNMPCAGDSTQICGGSNGINIFQNEDAGTTPTGPSVLAVYGAWVAQGCYVDSTAARSLPVGMAVTGGPAAMTVEKCLDACAASSYAFAGLEYSQECYCGSALLTQVANDGRCNMACKGAPGEICGGSNGLTAYQYGGSPPSSSSSQPSSTTPSTPVSVTSTTSVQSTFSTSSPAESPTTTGPTILESYGNWQSQGCYSDDPGARSLSFTANLNGITTPQRCMDACYNAGFSYAGCEYADECYCGGEVLNGGTLESDDGCNMTCNGDDTHYCGGSFRLNLYKYNGIVPTPTGGGTTSTIGPVTTGLPGSWEYRGCWVDNAHGRIMTFDNPASANNSAVNCISECTTAGYAIAGMEYGRECWCGNALVNAATQATDSGCNMACTGDPDHACGGPDRISLYAPTATFPVYPVPTVKTTGLPGSYEYLGCYAEPGGGLRVWPYQIENTTSNNVEQCLTLCSTYGYSAASLEFGAECWCGDPDMLTTKGATKAPETDCTMPCPGNPVDLCGGVERFNVYTWSTATPLYVWHTPANTGHYEFLIGGIVIPLIATLGLNNKVSFMEKYGTGAPNSTGAYELDYTLASDFDRAWRTMHVSSDVFCAANLVLPDRSGRVLSIGGWSYDSTEGVRLYTPSGSPGVNGTTDWEEHHDYLRLQKGRWYPGSMVMANGSILVVGGEEGSNGAPVPSLEILPQPSGGPTYLEMDWLLRTDPNNLYPFLFVLPGGGIFVLYFNEARILSETDFSTTKTFPIIPGAVNAAGGRTYPMEGTSVMLPQYAPYTDPIEILTCGGSAFGQALDNCVSIVPEGAGEWVIERMPSKRVMTLMAPLPDGTYLILGGAQQGVAGFGLAINPNLQALLYDPSQPRHQRISILGNTIVPRLYHSEATLLHDGRVMVSGSDPEDQVNPQEYRIEVYVPPYLTDGRVQPSYTIEARDWVYGGAYEIDVTLPQGPITAMRISLLGAISSTHGNSFGQRTFFPAFTCQGNTCTITAPPDPHICPPGWFQLFVLDGPTPSHSQWVRIGGDPGQLGNWPNYPGFTLPGMGSI